jgi:hypothetical protein
MCAPSNGDALSEAGLIFFGPFAGRFTGDTNDGTTFQQDHLRSLDL